MPTIATFKFGFDQITDRRRDFKINWRRIQKLLQRPQRCIGMLGIE